MQAYETQSPIQLGWRLRLGSFWYRNPLASRHVNRTKSTLAAATRLNELQLLDSWTQFLIIEHLI